MNIRDYQYLVLVDKLKHFGKAAEAAFVSQPALSMQIKKIEDELGVTIFERSNKQVFTTNIGSEIINHAKQILNSHELVKNTAKESLDPLAGELKIGAFPTLAPYIFPKIVPAISKELSKLDLFLVEEKTEVLLSKLNEGELDIALLALPIEQDNLSSISLFIDPFYLAVPKNHQYAKQQKVTQDILHNQTLLLLDEGHCLRDQALSLCNTIGAKENNNFRASSLETLRQMVIAGAGITLMPEIALDDNPHIIYKKFVRPAPVRKIGLVFRKSFKRKVLLNKLVELIYNQI